MRRRERQAASEGVAELRALLEVGDHHLAASTASRILADAGAAEPDRALARAALARTGKDPAAGLVALLCLAGWAAVAVLGLVARS